MSKNKDPWVRIINVSDPIRHKKGYTLYKVSSKVFPKNSIEAVSEVTVFKRYSEFKKLHKAIFALHQGLYLKDTFPPFAKARIFGRFDDSVIEERRVSALNLLQFAAKHPPLFTSQIFVKFFETGCITEEIETVVPPEEKVLDSILQPVKCDKLLDILCPNQTNAPDNCTQSESHTSLGGIWQHHQVSDTISLGSHRTDDDDDRTTFTDEESAASKLSLNLSEFDPLASCANVDRSLPDQNEICNSWLLSALQFCNTTTSEKCSENMLEFPKPFGDLENSEDLLDHLSKKQPDFKSESELKDIEPPDSTSSFQTTSSVCKEFDPLCNGGNQSEPKSPSNSKGSSTSHKIEPKLHSQSPYVLYAAKSICAAQEAESNEDFVEAFDLYKKAIDILLKGSQNETCAETKNAVHKKLLFFLMKAEEIYENKLPKCPSSTSKVEEHTSLFSYPMQNKISTFRGCVQDLKKYKVLGVLSKVLLVLDVNSSTTYIVKTLYKSSSSQSNNNPNIVPQNIPYMVQLVQVYETSYALFLVLEYASGGCLWDYVSSYLQRSPLSSCPEHMEEPKNLSKLSNVYSGKKVSDKVKGEQSQEISPKSPENVQFLCNFDTPGLDPDLQASQNCPPSYVALFKQYAATASKDNVALAKYHMSSNANSDLPEVGLLSLAEKKETSYGDGPFCTNFKETKKEERNAFVPQQHHSKVAKKRLSSTGSLETALSQKAGIFDAFNAMDDAVFQASSHPVHLPESCINLWAAEIVVALESLHKLGIIWMDFNPNNILLGAEGHILLTYQCKWNCVDQIVNENAKENFYSAPEVGNIFPVANDCDWWSFGVVMFELLTGKSLVSCYPTGITRHTVLSFPSEISPEAKDLLSKLLQYNASERLGSGIYGVEEIKSHPFFRTIGWESLYQT